MRRHGRQRGSLAVTNQTARHRLVTNENRRFLFSYQIFTGVVTDGDAFFNTFSLVKVSYVKRAKLTSPFVTNVTRAPKSEPKKGPPRSWEPCGYKGRDNRVQSSDRALLTGRTWLLRDGRSDRDA